LNDGLIDWRINWLIDWIIWWLISNWVRALTVLMHPGLINRPIVLHNLIPVQGSIVPLLKFKMAPRRKLLMFSASKGKKPRSVCLSEAKASHSQRVWAEVSSSATQWTVVQPHYIKVSSQGVMSGKKANNNPELCPVKGQKWYSEWLRAGRSGNRIPVGARFSASVQTGPGAYPASCTMGNRVFPGGKVRPGRDADHSPPSNAEFLEESSYTATLLWATTGPVPELLYFTCKGQKSGLCRRTDLLTYSMEQSPSWEANQ